MSDTYIMRKVVPIPRLKSLKLNIKKNIHSESEFHLVKGKKVISVLGLHPKMTKNVS